MRNRETVKMKLISPRALWGVVGKQKNRSKLLCLDVGMSKIGVAISDEMRTTAYPLKMMYRKRGGRKMGSVPEDLQRIVHNTKAAGLVVGWPLDLEGLEGPQCQKTNEFVRSLIFRGTLSIPATYWDERYSTVNAEENWGTGRGIDAFAALEILQDYMDEMNEEDEDHYL